MFIRGLGKAFYALSREDGHVAWSYDCDGSMSDSSPRYHDGAVYVYIGSGGGSVYSLDDEDGAVLWQ